MSEELKPCPFPACKSDAILDVHNLCEQAIYQVQCDECGALGPIERSAYLAIEAWNRRTLLQDEKE